MKILVIDNYDSFTYNLVHMLRKISNCELTVLRNDKFETDELNDYDKILISPGPGVPDEAGLVKKVIAKYAKEKSLLGICLGHQAIAEVFGAKLMNMKNVLHGVSSKASILSKDSLFNGLPEQFNIGHYHSWVVDKKTIGNELDITSENESGLIMSIRHKHFDVKGLQFHPESVLTHFGQEIIANWVHTPQKA